jgi:hypothetical protein
VQVAFGGDGPAACWANITVASSSGALAAQAASAFA